MAFHYDGFDCNGNEYKPLMHYRRKNMKSRYLLVGIAAAGLSLSACNHAVQTGNGKLEEKIDNLTKALEEHEAANASRINQINEKLAAMEGKLGNSGPQKPDMEREREASQMLGEINSAVTSGNYEEAKKLLPEMMSKYSGTRAANAARSMAAEISVLGKDAPAELQIEKWLSGDPVNLSGAKPTVLIFWEYWCPHCKREVPNLQKMYDANKEKGLKMVGLTRMSRDVEESTVMDFIKENKLTYPIAKEGGDMANYFSVSGIPAAAIVKDGKIVWRGHPARIPQDKLAEWLM